jgi:hypothetical protein
MKILFTRNTHNEKGEYRGDAFFGPIDHERELFFGPHTLNSKEGMTLEEVYQETFKALHGGALSGTFDPKDPRLTIEGHLKALAYMIEHKLIKAECLVG